MGSGAAIDTFLTVHGEGNHKGCPYTDAVCDGALSIEAAEQCGPRLLA